MQFEGKFRPPGMGTTEKPILIGGPGRCRLTDDGLTVDGFEVPTRGPLTLLAFGVFFCAAIGLSIHFGIDVELPAIAAIVATLVVSVALGKRGKKERGDPIEVIFPWSKIKKVKVENEAAVVVVAGFDPSGGLHFAPNGPVEPFVDAINAALARHKPS